MSAKLVITSGPGQGSEFHIEAPVLRLGSGGQCQWCLPESHLAAHAATLEFRDGGYILHNRGDDPVELAGQQLSKHDSAPWPAEEEADFGHGVTVRLEIDGDPAPAKAPGPMIEIEVDPEEIDESEAAKRRRGSGGFGKTLQILVIVAALPLAAWMLMMDSSGEDKSAGQVVDFGELIKKLEDSPTDKAREPHSFRSILQRAHAAELHGDRKEARAQYGCLRDTLLLLPRTPEGNFQDADNEVWKYVMRRLQGLYAGETP